VLGTDFLTIGNTNDFLWHPSSPSCNAAIFETLGLPVSVAVGLIPDFTDTQFLEDQGDGSGHYGRAFSSNTICVISVANELNHLDVLSAANVVTGIKHFFSPVGQTPSPLKINPFQS
jgi:hypothetical protein